MQQGHQSSASIDCKTDLLEADVLIIGSGIAGISAALRLARDSQRHIIVITRETDPKMSSTYYAQGGIATVGDHDSSENFVSDILRVGAGASWPLTVEILVTEGPQLVEKIIIDEAGLRFDRISADQYHYTREGAHSTARILHVGDQTGAAILEALHSLLPSYPNIRLITGVTAVDLITFPHHSLDPLSAYEPITCHGAYVLDTQSNAVHRYLAGATILATGGFSRLYRYTTNPSGARGDGLAMAYRAGAHVINTEYVQFHPTSFAVPESENFLITEAVRGEGGRLLTPDGHYFMNEYAPQWGDLAPRDVVARAIQREMTLHDFPYVLLDISQVENFSDRFPAIYTRCREYGIDLPTAPIPVVPAAHYCCGGIWTDLWGKTTIRNLYAVGEVACSGVHGANRLAGTSLLEGLVFGDRAGRHIAAEPARLIPVKTIPPWEFAPNGTPADPALLHRDWRSIQYTMWYYVGLSRDAHRLNRAIQDLLHLRKNIVDFYQQAKLNDALLGLRNAVQSALIVAESAWHNRRSIGVHFRTDSKDSAEKP
ncbi:L-aspartate oxidase [Candidatus Acetothermia bacterium]|jgi:L-aspartate oxidase|nr:L-aspartate oxidase [Candidatus Acetothermia bacterium]MCI2427625.1 L-aspartate oxidase [Candidatus Acetothermia bacterium]MCI2428474.1 L-aspartate oxidase [Candidatus Acetothermia bacterium]